jgi:hypothetical protein
MAMAALYHDRRVCAAAPARLDAARREGDEISARRPVFSSPGKEAFMKRQLAFVVLFVLCALAGFGQSATFSEPKAGAVLVMGQAQPIAWSGSGSATVKLVLVSKTDGKAWIIKSGLAIVAGSWSWKVGSLENGKTAPAGLNYLVRMQNMANDAIIAKTGQFSIGEPAAQAPVVMDPNLKLINPPPAVVVMNPVLLKAQVPATQPPPDAATFKIKKIDYRYESPGRLGWVDVIVSVSTPAAFSISPAYGDPQYGAQWISCEIDIPNPTQTTGVWSASYFSGILSVKAGGGSQQLQYPTKTFAPGTSEYLLCFYAAGSGEAKGVGTAQKMPSGYCKHTYFPRLTVNLFVRTATKTVKLDSKAYLLYDIDAWPINWIMFSGETNLCAGGVVEW